MIKPIDPKLVAFMDELADLLEKHDALLAINYHPEEPLSICIFVGHLHDFRLDLHELTSDIIRGVNHPQLEKGTTNENH